MNRHRHVLILAIAVLAFGGCATTAEPEGGEAPGDETRTILTVCTDADAGADADVPTDAGTEPPCPDPREVEYHSCFTLDAWDCPADAAVIDPDGCGCYCTPTPTPSPTPSARANPRPHTTAASPSTLGPAHPAKRRSSIRAAADVTASPMRAEPCCVPSARALHSWLNSDATMGSGTGRAVGLKLDSLSRNCPSDRPGYSRRRITRDPSSSSNAVVPKVTSPAKWPTA